MSFIKPFFNLLTVRLLHSILRSADLPSLLNGLPLVAYPHLRSNVPCPQSPSTLLLPPSHLALSISLSPMSQVPINQASCIMSRMSQTRQAMLRVRNKSQLMSRMSQVPINQAILRTREKTKTLYLRYPKTKQEKDEHNSQLYYNGMSHVPRCPAASKKMPGPVQTC